MAALLALSRAIDRLNAGFACIAEYLVFAAILVSAGNALMRYVFNITSNAYLEVQWYMFAAIVMLAAAYTLRLNEHVRVDLVYANLSDRGRLLIDIFGIVLFLMPFTLYMLYLAWPFFWDSFISGETSSNEGGLIRWPAKIVLPLGFLLLFLQGVFRADQADRRADRPDHPRAALRTAGAIVFDYGPMPPLMFGGMIIFLLIGFSGRVLAGGGRLVLRLGGGRHWTLRVGVPAQPAVPDLRHQHPVERALAVDPVLHLHGGDPRKNAAWPRTCSRAPGSCSARCRAASPMR